MLSRRNLMLAMPAILLLPREASAYSECSGIDSRGIKTCTVGLKIGVETVRQRCEWWCWAACIEAIFNLNGHQVDQEVIAEKLFGSAAVCAPALPEEILYAIEGYWVDGDGKEFYASGQQLANLGRTSWGGEDVNLVIEELKQGRPLVNGAVGHATVLTAVTYEQERYFNPVLREIIVRDPWPDSPNRRALNVLEIAGSFFVAKVTVS